MHGQNHFKFRRKIKKVEKTQVTMPEARMELASLIAVEVCSFAAVLSFSWLLALPQYRSLLS